MRYSRADLHIHTTFSDGSASPEAVVAHVARHTDLAVIAITDHDTIAGAQVAARIAPDYGIDVVVGAEISTRAGHLLALYIHAPIPAHRPVAETIAAIHAQGGLAIPAHPASMLMPSLGRAVLRHASASTAPHWPIDGLETFNASLWLGWNNRRAQSMAAALGMAMVGGSDAHQLATIGSGYTRFPGRTAVDLYHAIRACQTEAGGSLWGLWPNARLIGQSLGSFIRDSVHTRRLARPRWSQPVESQLREVV
jgi:predicted metal-dependent phosphoesterase TrpH